MPTFRWARPEIHAQPIADNIESSNTSRGRSELLRMLRIHPALFGVGACWATAFCDTPASNRPVFCCGQKSELLHHSYVVAGGVVVDDLAVAQGIPVHNLHFEVLVSGCDAFKHAAIDRRFPYAKMSAAFPASNNNPVIFCDQVNDVETEIRKGRPDILQYERHNLAPYRQAEVPGILGEIGQSSLPIAAIQSIMMGANKGSILRRVIRHSGGCGHRSRLRNCLVPRACRRTDGEERG